MKVLAPRNRGTCWEGKTQEGGNSQIFDILDWINLENGRSDTVDG